MSTSQFSQHIDSNICRHLSGIDLSGIDSADAGVNINMHIAVKIITYIKRLEEKLDKKDRLQDEIIAHANNSIDMYKALNNDLLKQVQHIQFLNNVFIVMAVVITIIYIVIVLSL